MFVKIFSMDSEKFCCMPPEKSHGDRGVRHGRQKAHAPSENAMALIARDAFDYFQNLRTD